MEKYINRAFLWDTVLAIAVVLTLYFMRSKLSFCLDIPSISNIDKIGESLISIGATLIGFLLTIITVIITFKKGFDSESKTSFEPETNDFTKVPDKTVFDKKTSKEKQFYGSDMHKKVLKVFIGATYEIGLVILILLILQFDLFKTPHLVTALVTLGCLIMSFLTTLRSINIFKAYLNVHTGNNDSRSN